MTRYKRDWKIGLKLWSVNVRVCGAEAQRLYERGVYDYLELYAVPGTADTLPLWKTLEIPVIIHAAHFKHGFNLARRECEAANRRIADEARRFADELGAVSIIFHGGTFGCIEETAQQLAELGEPRALIENKPAITYNEGRTLECRGSTVAEIARVMQVAGCGLCLDIPHALCAANFYGIPQDGLLRSFCALNPAMYHLADMKDSSLTVDDHTPLGQGVLDIRRFIPGVIAPGSRVTIETKRQRADSLAEFEEELAWLEQFWPIDDFLRKG